MYDGAKVYRDLRGVTGESPDADRGYGLFQRAPDPEQRVATRIDKTV